MKSLCVITIKLNTPTDVPYQMTVGGAFVYICERDFEQQSREYNVVRYNAFFPMDSVVMESHNVNVTLS